MYKIEFSLASEKQLYKLSKDMQVRIISSLERIRIRPYPHIKKLVGIPYFRLRVGDYRVILDIKNSEVVILVIEIGHRSSIYK
jgi:mRNA interferase RelE/StbE